MILKQQSENLGDYLEETAFVDYRSSVIVEKSNTLFAGLTVELEIIKVAYEFVRDQMHHSHDIGGRLITKTASEVLTHRQGMCYAKTMLLAALLRGKGIPTGFCYQSLAVEDKMECKHDIHALNAVYLSKFKQWVRLDPRGNVGGKNAQFYLDDPFHEQLVYSIREEYGEVEYPTVYVCHPDCVMRPLLICIDCQDMMEYFLPDTISDS